jgi:hypothetical protein
MNSEDLRLAVYRALAGTGRAPDGGQVAHFLVPAARMWDDVVHTCAHQRLFCSEDCVDSWLAVTGSARGYVMDLATLWRLAAHWYDGRLDRGYVRREPSQAAAYTPPGNARLSGIAFYARERGIHIV